MIKIAASSLALGTMLFLGAAQAEPLKLTTSQMDQVTAGQPFDIDLENVNVNLTFQRAVAVANACRQAGCGNDSIGGAVAAAVATAYNTNATVQANSERN
jgi:hypothetical protein